MAVVAQAAYPDSSVDKLLKRSLDASELDSADLDGSTIGKPAHLLVSRGLSGAAYRPKVLVRSSGGAGPQQALDATEPQHYLSGDRGDSLHLSSQSSPTWTRRDAFLRTMGVVGVGAASQSAGPAEANINDSLQQRLRAAEAGKKRMKMKTEIPLSDYKEIPGTSPPILYYDLVAGKNEDASSSAKVVRDGQRVAIHYDLKYKRLTVATSRQGMGVTGGNPYGFDPGVPAGKPGGPFIPAFNLGIRGMEVGMLRRLIVPPKYAYGPNQVQEIPPDSTLTLDIEVLDILRGPT
eukprot:gnl/TRDRNA2_/TRDRNA2_128550_c0_seq1.p1 gnl/TRDRNA2_/TRDRNA2_128550_c0~~gnl/TRDRNA2_/TRDRNA2_128550_c0_seq1.p1  ORF type:complete len:333 (-),score=50.42 gnl/TRDRNA2_/TRDRNA2_128550_c0_seq1:74-949(-)